MHITEPVTMLTDYALAAANLFFTLSILPTLNSRNKVTALLLTLGFLAGAISGGAGGTFHGFSLHFEEAALKRLWNLTLCSIGATGAFFVSAVHAADVRREEANWMISAVVVTLIGLGIQVTGFRSHEYFNHNDIFHVVQIGAMYLFFRGARYLNDRPYSQS